MHGLTTYMKLYELISYLTETVRQLFSSDKFCRTNRGQAVKEHHTCNVAIYTYDK